MLLNKVENSFRISMLIEERRCVWDLLGDVVPHDYQMFGINWLTKAYGNKDKYGVLLGDEMGLGKTLQVRPKFLVCI